MKKIVKNPSEDKPYRLLFNYRIKDYMFDYHINVEDMFFEDILLTQGRKDYLSSRSRTIWFSCYMPEKLFELLLNDIEFEHCAYAYHDKDIYTEDEVENGKIVHRVGELKKPHIHCLITFAEKYTFSNIAFNFHTMNIKGIDKYNLSSWYKYLIHDSDECRKDHKYQYPESVRKFSSEYSKEYFLSRCIDTEFHNNCMTIIDDFMKGLPHRQLVEKYGRDFVYHYNFYIKIASIVAKEEKLARPRMLIDKNNDGSETLCIIDSDGTLHYFDSTEKHYHI